MRHLDNCQSDINRVNYERSIRVGSVLLLLQSNLHTIDVCSRGCICDMEKVGQKRGQIYGKFPLSLLSRLLLMFVFLPCESDEKQEKQREAIIVLTLAGKF